MKKFGVFLSSFMVVFSFVACGGGSTVNNKYLGEYPSMVKNSRSRLAEKEKEVKNCTDFQRAFKLSKEQELLEEEMDKKVEEYLAVHSLEGVALPFKALENPDFEVTKVVVNKAYASSLNLKFSLKVKRDIKSKYGSIKKTLFLYFKAIDKEGNEIAKTKTVAANFKRIQMKAGIECEVFGTWKGSKIMLLENFAEVMQISEKEYKQK